VRLARLATASVNLLTFPLSVPAMKALTGTTYLDMCAFCSASDVQRALTTFGEAGRDAQLRLLSSIDIAIPVMSCAFGVAALSYLARRRWLVLLPVAAMVLDFVENAIIAVLVHGYPDVPLGLAAAEGWVSGAKLVAYAATVAVIVIAGGFRAWHRSGLTKY